MGRRPDGRQYTGGFRIATFFPASAVTDLLADAGGLAKAVEGVKAMGAEHVFLEVYRGGHVADEAVLARARDAFVAAGIRVGGALTTTWGAGFGASAVPQPVEQGSLFCYLHPKTVEDISRVSGVGGRLFDEFMLDDFFFTNCECDACRAARGDGPWWAARNRILADFAAKAVIAPAHAANPDCTVIIKYPQWYDRFHQFGYDAAAQTAQFDAIWVGTETRDPHADDQFGPVQQAQSWSAYRWLCDVGGAKTLAGWFDPYGCDESSYVEQGYQNVLIGAPEVLLFNYASLHQDRYRPLLEALEGHWPRLRRWSAALGGARPAGVACYKPPNSFPRGEYYVFDYLTMMGLPTTMHATFPADAACVFCPGHALADPAAAERAREVIARGGTVLASAEFVRGLPAATAEDLFGLRPRGSLDEGPALTEALHRDGKTLRLDGPLEVTGVLASAGADVLLAWAPEEQLAPLLTRKRHGAGAAIMLDTVTNALGGRTGVNITRWVPLTDLPAEALNCIRAAVGEALSLAIRGPGRVGVYAFAGRALAVCNYRNAPADVEVRVGPDSPVGPLDRLAPEPDSGATIRTRRGDLLALTLPARGRVLLATEGR